MPLALLVIAMAMTYVQQQQQITIFLAHTLGDSDD